MPLVPLNTVQRWYQRDSWVYAGFKYWFQNALWNVSVPQGFSLCPYFWMSIFSVFLRLFVVAVLGVRVAFKPFGSLLDIIDSVGKKFGIKGSRGAPTAVIIAICWLLFIALYYGIPWVGSIVAAYKTAGVLYALVLPVILTVIALPCWINIGMNQYNDKRCKVEWYIRIAAVACVALAIHFGGFKLFIDPVIEFASGAWLLITFVSSHVWWFIAHLPGWIWTGVAGSFVWVWRLLIAIVIEFTWIAITFGILAIIGWGFDRFYLKSPEHIRDVTTQRTATNNLERFGRSCYYMVRRQYGDVEWDLCDNLRRLKAEFWERYIRCVPEAVGLAYDLARNGTPVTEEHFDRAARAAIDTYIVEWKESQKARELRHQKCQTVTTSVGNVAAPAFDFVGAGFKATGRGIVWCAKQFWTFLCLLWELMKARKQGACPYLKFQDPPKPSIVVNGKKLA